MLHIWTEILPLFVVRWLAKRSCERLPFPYGQKIETVVVIARPDTYFTLGGVKSK